MATFPTYAKLLLAGYTEEADYGVLRTEMDGGIAKQRPRWSKPIVTRDANIKVADLTRKRLFDTWAKTELNGVAGWFDFYDCVAGATRQARIVGGKYKWSSPGVIWIAQCQIETIG